MDRLRIIVTGLIAQHPWLGGVAWDYLQYPLGLARLGHDVYYVEDSGQWPYTLDGGPTGGEWIASDCTPNVRHLAAIMARFGLGDRWAYRFPIRPRWFGLPHHQRCEVVRTADLLLNVSGTLHRPTDYRSVRRLAYIDSDPVFTQVKLSLPRGQRKFQKRMRTHDVFFSFGEALAEHVPATGIRWRPTRQPIVLPEWKPAPDSPRDVFTTVMSWTSYRPLRHRGQRYGQKDVELRRFLDLPRRVRPATLEVALSGTRHVEWETDAETPLPADVRDLATRGDWSAADLLAHMGWRVVDAAATCPDLDTYRRYVQTSLAEWSVAKNGYVRGRCGWFSGRSACYLAAGRPVVVQDTGFGSALPVGDGILPFQTIDEAVAAIGEVRGNYARHAAAARALAAEHFDSDRVLRQLVAAAMATDA